MDQTQIKDMLFTVEPLIVKIGRRKFRHWPNGMFDDACQHVRIALWQRVLPKYDPSRGTLEAFAVKAIDNLFRSELRTLRRKRPSFQFTDLELADLTADDETDDAHPIDAELTIIQEALAELSPTDAALFQRIIDREPETASNAKADTLHMRKHRALKRLRQILSERPDAPAA